VQWTTPGGSVRIPISVDSSGAVALDFRIAGEPDAPPVELDVRVRDASGAWKEVGRRLTLRSYHGPSPLGKIVARQLRASLRGTPIDPRDITMVELIPRTPEGRFWLLDISARGDFAASHAIHLPRISVGDVTVAEGDAGENNRQPARHRRRRRHAARPAVGAVDRLRQFRSADFRISARTRAGCDERVDTVYLPRGRRLQSLPQLTQVTLLAQKNAATGDFDGTVLVEEDEPAPVLTVDAAQATAAEDPHSPGRSVCPSRWRMAHSGRSN
jgi:hypothetical protein